MPSPLQLHIVRLRHARSGICPPSFHIPLLVARFARPRDQAKG
jgi:hypothetical protein